MQKHEIRPPAVAGSFYPDDPEELRRMVQNYLKKASSQSKFKKPEKIYGLISPHAGYPYSGLTAAFGYSLLEKNEFKKVIVVSPSHRDYFDGVSVCPARAYSTPLGELEIDLELKKKFLSLGKKKLIEDYAGHAEEHALEVQLPFLQETLGEFKLLPLVMGNQSRELCEILSDALAEIVKDEKILMVASSDLSHFYDYEKANKMDSFCAEPIAQFDTDTLMKNLNSPRFEACGGGPILSVMLAAKKLGAQHAVVLHHCNSGDMTGDRSRVVGYLSAVIY